MPGQATIWSVISEVLSFYQKSSYVCIDSLSHDTSLFPWCVGLPAPHFSYVKNIEPGLPLFLFNYSDKKLYGIYEAASSGKLNINPYGWTVDGAEKTKYPAQVRWESG